MTRARVRAQQAAAPPKGARLLRGTVSAVAPLTVQLAGGGAVAGVPLPGAAYNVGDVVLVLTQEPAVGPVYPIPGGTAVPTSLLAGTIPTSSLAGTIPTSSLAGTIPASSLSGTVAAAQLAGLLTLTAATLTALPNGTVLGQAGVALDTGITYRWMGATPKWYPWESAWIAYTPAWAGVTPGTGSTSNARYRWVGGMVQARAWLNFGSSPAITGQVSHALPEPARVVSNSAYPYLTGSVLVRDATGANLYPGALALGNGASTASLYAQNAAGTYLAHTAMTASGIPIAVAQSEQLFTDVTYESNNYPQ